MASFFIVSFLMIFAAYFAYNFVNYLEIYKVNSSVNDKKCEVLRGAIGIEDLVKLDKYLIGGSDDRGKLWEFWDGCKNTPDGRMIYIDTSVEYDNLKIKTLPMNNFPKDIAFHPHGIYLYKDKFIYAINHAYHKGGERVEVFEIIKKKEKIQLNYLRSIVYSPEFAGIFNDLIVVGEDEVFITTWLPFADNVEHGRSHNLFHKLQRLVPLGLGLPLTYIYHCKGSTCTKVKGSSSLMNNGITYDYEHNKVFAVNVFKRRVRVYKLEKTNEFNLKFEKDIQLGYALDNVEYDKETGIIYGGVIGRVMDLLNIEKHIQNNLNIKNIGHGGSLQIKTRENDKVELLVLQDDLYGISGSIRHGDLIFHGSLVDEGVAVCKLEQ